MVVNILNRLSFDEWNLHFLSYWTIKRLAKKNDLNFKIIYEVSSNNKYKQLLKQSLRFFGIHHSALLRTVMLVLEKDE